MLSRPIRVLQIIDTFGMGGVETWLIETLRHWAHRGEVQTDFLLTSGKRGIFDDEAARLGARLHYVPYGMGKLSPFISAYRDILRNGRYDAVHDHADYVSGWHFLMGLGALPRVRVAHVHNPWLHITANYATSSRRMATAKMGKFLTERLATHVLGTSGDALERYGFRVGSCSPHVSVLHCGFDIRRFSGPRENDRSSVLEEFGWTPDARVVLFAGRLDRALEIDHPQNHKNSWLALNTMRTALTRNPNLRLVMAGAGDSRGEMQKYLQAWGLESQFRLVGVRQDMPRLLRAADLLFFPSRQEGLGMVAVEAQAAGVPVLASDGIPLAANVVPQLYHAFKLGSSIEEWAQAVQHALDAPRVPPEIAAQTVEKTDFSIAASAEKLLRVYGSASA
jgi:glycosyltransferase involved in cell wall biosynthesis